MNNPAFWGAFFGGALGSVISGAVVYLAGRRSGMMAARTRVTAWLTSVPQFPGGCGDRDCIYCGKHGWPRV